ncbi:hypothetical protein F2Q69_00013918 [Brassica cretica]|uniref:Uncharacterized protein n=1 Tax=Brassica cretica TaxID=69181 RepID=A0A8S9RA36_BRACR|nr:hypothetical protein F2Q69_00013918 [Brassica cretica]
MTQGKPSFLSSLTQPCAYQLWGAFSYNIVQLKGQEACNTIQKPMVVMELVVFLYEKKDLL